MTKRIKMCHGSKLSASLVPSIAGVAATFSLTAGLFTISTMPATAQELCSEYKIVSGDTLSGIANKAGVRGGFQVLYNANTGVLSNPNLVEVGQVLQIPCADGSLPQAASAEAKPAAQPATPAPSIDRPLRIVTATGYAPFTDEDSPGGGVITQMVNRSMELGNPDQEYSLLFINDWGSHLNTLLPSGAADMVFPWFKPDCAKVENLSEGSAFRCTDFNHSEPFYEALVGFYTLKGSPYEGAATYAELKGAHLCRPEAWFTFDLEAEQLMPPNVELTRPESQDGCWQLLMDGEVDVITLDALPAEEDARELGFSDRVAKLESLTSAQTLHIFVAKDNQLANDALPIINSGLQQMRTSGEWFNIVRAGIKETIEN
jgi:polar amino acid transport system substrate-binding protein